MDIKTIDRLHEEGKMPTWAWVQQNGRSAEENWEYQRKEMMNKINEQRRQKQQEEALEKHITEMIEEKLESCLENVLDDLLKGFK